MLCSGHRITESNGKPNKLSLCECSVQYTYQSAHVVFHVANGENERAVVHFVVQQAPVERREREVVLVVAVDELPREALRSQKKRARHLHSSSISMSMTSSAVAVGSKEKHEQCDVEYRRTSNTISSVRTELGARSSGTTTERLSSRCSSGSGFFCDLGAGGGT